MNPIIRSEAALVRQALLAILCATGLLATCAEARARCVECANQMMSATLQGNITYNRETTRVREDTRRELQRLRGNAGSSALGAGANPSARRPIGDRLEDELTDSLASEFERRLVADGKPQAAAWYTGALRSLGGSLGRRYPEYQRRQRGDGQAKADAWYLSMDRSEARSYLDEVR